MPLLLRLAEKLVDRRLQPLVLHARTGTLANYWGTSHAVVHADVI